jgi:hypothetical protein
MKVSMVEVTRPERRRAERFVPRETVRVDLEFEQGVVARGVIADISECGACVTTEAMATLHGKTVLMQLTFTGEPQAVLATSRIVWTSDGGRLPVRYGLEWTHVGPQRARLQRLIGRLAAAV